MHATLGIRSSAMICKWKSKMSRMKTGFEFPE